MKSKMKSTNSRGLVKFVLAGALLAGLCPSVFAAPVGTNDVARAMKNWRHRNGTLGAKLGETVKDVRKMVHNGTAFHVVRFEGGGHLIAPTDTKLRPVLMLSGSDDFVLDAGNPALALLMTDIKAESSRLGVGADAASTAGAPRSRNENEWADLLDDNLDAARKETISDVRVAPLLTTKWDQSTVVGGQGGTKTKKCYNYYTPNEYYCGCVATATAQIMKYFEWPQTSVGQFTSQYTKVDEVVTPLTTLGGTFDWANMLDQPSYSSTETQRQAVGKLTSDVGIILGMGYTADGSGAYTGAARYALTKTVLGYSNAMLYENGNKTGNEEDFRRVMISNFNAKRPVQLSIPGHSIVGDGYGYNNGTLYYHLNMGWGGSWDYWYSVPVNDSNPITDDKNYNCFQGVVYNIFTEESPDNVILSGRVTDGGTAVANMPVVALSADGTEVATGTTDAKGLYAMLVPPGEYTVVASKDNDDQKTRKYGTATGTALKCVTIDITPADGVDWPYGEPVMGNCSDCDITVATEACPPEAEVSVGDAQMLRDFASATVPVTVKVLHYGATAESADVIVTLTPVGGGAAVTKTFSIAGDFDAHTFDAEFGDLTAGGAYVVSAQVKMDGVAAKSTDDGFPASRKIAWFDESAASFTSAKWSGGEVKAESGKLSVSDSTFTPDSNADSVKRIEVCLSKGKAYTADTVPAFDSYAGVSAIVQDNGQVEVVVGGNGAWQPTGVFFPDADLAFNVVIDLDFAQDTVRYTIGSTVLGPYGLSAANVTSIAFKGKAALSAFSGAGLDANLVKDAAGNEYATFAAAKDAGATGVLSPLWQSTWDLGSASGSVEVYDPKNFIEYTGDSKVIKTDDLGDDNKRLWFAQASDADVPSARNYIETTVDLGLAKAITDASVVQIGDFAVANGAMSFKVKIDDVEIAKKKVKEFVRVSTDLANWNPPAEKDIAFDETTHIITVTPPTGEGVNSGFTRILIPEEK